MNTRNYLFKGMLLSLIIISNLAFSQKISERNVLKYKIKKANEELQHRFMEEASQSSMEFGKQSISDPEKVKRTLTHILNIRKNLPKFSPLTLSPDTVYLGDTLVIGFTPGDELIIDSAWTHTGPIIVMGDGLLQFQNAEATILGNIYLVENARVIADSSSLCIPQQYFYQRIVLLTGHSRMEVHNSTIDFGGLVHNWATTDSAVLLFDHVTKPDFSTIGMYGQSSIIIDSVDVAGEFIVDDSVHLQIAHANSVLAWHQFGDEAEIDISFPDGEYVENYGFSDEEAGVSGIDYSIQINNCGIVWWGLMPSNGSDVTITDSDIRAIGLWFEGSDSSSVSGLVNNSHYDNFTAPLDDRYFHLNNCDVMTWSLYTFDDVVVEATGCILGEIGVMGRSVANAFNLFIDGSGGYFFGTDTTFSVIGFSALTSSLRSSGNSFLIFAYASQMNGLVQALEHSVLMLIQSSTIEAPTYDAGSVVWMANIMFPSSGFVDSMEPIYGSAWIDKGAASDLMDFGHYTMYYQTSPDTTWYIINEPSESEVREDVLVNWNTQNLKPGAYFLKLDLVDNWGNLMTATKPFTLLPLVVGTDEIKPSKTEVQVYPNPFSSTINFEIQDVAFGELEIHIHDGMGREVFVNANPISVNNGRLQVNGSRFTRGIYYYQIKMGSVTYTGKLVKL